MLRILIAVMAVAALVVPAMGYTITNPSNTFDINLNIGEYVQIIWQGIHINFNGSTDWWCRSLDHVGYAACPDSFGHVPTDNWAGDNYPTPNGMYYESGDGADIWVKSNTLLSMKVTTTGDLKGVSTNATIPTWFTTALSGPFVIGGAQLVGTVPFSPSPGGHYLYDAGSSVFGHADDGGANPVPGGSVPAGYDNYPDQYPFPCVPAATNWTLVQLTPYVEGNIKFLARCYRLGMADAADTYVTNLNVLFSSP